MVFAPGGSEWIVIFLIVLLLFGSKKVPELARSIGKAKLEYKKGMEEGELEEQKEIRSSEAEAEEAEEEEKPKRKRRTKRKSTKKKTSTKRKSSKK